MRPYRDANRWTGPTLALSRIAVGAMFVLFGQYKLASSQFAHEGFSKYLTGYIQHDAVRWYAALLEQAVLPHVVPFGYAVGAVELLIGLSLVLGLSVRFMSALGALYMVNFLLSTWWAPGTDAPLWQYFGAELDHLSLLLLFLIFLATDAGRHWGLDSFGKRRLY